MPPRRLTVVVLITLLLTACTAASPGATPSVAESAASVQPSDDGTPTGSQNAEATPKPCVPGFVCSDVLTPGDYTSTSLGPTLTFTIAEGTSGIEDTPPVGFALFFDAVGGRHAMTVTSFPGTVFSEVCSPETTETIGTAPADFIAFLAAVDGVTAEPAVNTTVGGRPAIRLDLTTDSPCSDPDDMWLWQVEVEVYGDFHFNDAERARGYAIDGGGVTIVVIIEAFPDADFDVLLTASEAVLASMVITPAT